MAGFFHATIVTHACTCLSEGARAQRERRLPGSRYARCLAGGETPVDAGILSEMLSASDSQLGSLRSALAGVEKALRAEAIQNQRIRLAMDKAKKMARYAEADRIAAERRAEQERLEREGEGR